VPCDCWVISPEHYASSINVGWPLKLKRGSAVKQELHILEAASPKTLAVHNDGVILKFVIVHDLPTRITERFAPLSNALSCCGSVIRTAFHGSIRLRPFPALYLEEQKGDGKQNPRHVWRN